MNVKARGKRQRDAVGQPLPLQQERDTGNKGKACNDFPTPSRRVRERSSWPQLVGVGETHEMCYNNFESSWLIRAQCVSCLQAWGVFFCEKIAVPLQVGTT